MTDVSVNTLTATEVRRLCGDLPDATVEAILGTGATFADLEAAAAWDDVAAMSETATAIRQILDEDAGWDDDRA